MTREEAFNDFFKFLRGTMRAREYHNSYFGIDGTRVCAECKNHKINPVYIRCNPESPLYLKCFRAGCDNSRKLTEKDLLDMGYTNREAIKLLIKNVKKKSTVFDKGYNEDLYVDHTRITGEQLLYMVDRCKISLTAETIFQYKVIPDLKHTLEYSPHIKINADKFSLNPKNTICFHSDNENKFVCRGIGRDFKLSLTADPDMVGNYYTLNIGKQNKSVMFVCEGVFDCINVFNMNQNIDKDAVFIATFGFASYKKAIEFYYQKYIDSVEHLILVMDGYKFGDTYSYSVQEVKDLIKSLQESLGKRFVKRIDVIYNSASKDFGDFREPISVEVDKIYEGGKFYI